jgi:hypothetical protein
MMAVTALGGGIVVTGLVRTAQAQLPPIRIDSQTIVYAGGLGAGFGLIDADGANPQTIPPPPVQGVSDPALSPDGTRVVFSGLIRGTGFDDGVYVMNVDGSNPRFLWPGQAPRWSPDGTKIAFVGDGIEVGNADGSRVHQVASGNAGIPTVDWSPDGTKVIFDDSNQIYAVPATGGPAVQLTHLPLTTSIYGERWSPDGTEIAFVEYHTSGPRTLDVVHPDGTDERQLFSIPLGNGYFSWAPDSQRLVIVGMVPNGLLAIVGLDGTVLAQLPSGPADVPSWVELTVRQPPSCQGGYRLAGADGGLFTFGDAGFVGSAADLRLNKQVVGIAASPAVDAYWLVGADGGVFAFGHPGFFGSAAEIPLNQPVAGMTPTPDGNGYWLVARDGGVFSFGDARFYGSTAAMHLSQPIVGMASTPDGAGYWLVDATGRVAAFGDARSYGSTTGVHLNQPIVAITPSADGKGYWLAARDGGVFAFGDAPFLGSGVNAVTNPIVGIASSPTGSYWLADDRGGVFSFVGAPFCGTANDRPLAAPIVGISS